MSLPDGFLDELRNRTSLAQVVGRKVMWDSRKSNQGKGDMWAPCPFHQEKSASFHVDDRQGYYYCFGCHAKGDAISFVRETENVNFIEAVEILAREAGMELPARDPKAQVVADRRTVLADAMEQAVKWFGLQLRSGAGADARAYLKKRGLDEAAVNRWEIGFAPQSWEDLREAMVAKGVAVQDLLDCGLVKSSDKGRAPYDVFRGRIMFPIRDGRGRAIAFGGRAMDPGESAKYLNSPETLLFDKGRSLFNLGPARTATGKGQQLIVAEGYMDVIALGEAGFEAAVAPLGTAVTETQLQLMWRLHPEPVITLDGDAAGQRAAMRLIDLALPMLEPGRTLRFCVMPEGMDPDDLIKAKGAAAMQGLLDGAVPLVQMLWQRETEGRVLDSPERKAALDKSLREAVAKIRDASVRGRYEEEIRQLSRALFWQARSGGQGRKSGPKRAWGAKQPEGPTPSARASYLAAPEGSFAEENLHEAVFLSALLACPACVIEFEDALERTEMIQADHQQIRDALLIFADQDAEMIPDLVRERIGAGPLEKLMSLNHVRISAAVRHPGNVDMAGPTISEALSKLSTLRAKRREIEEAEKDIRDLSDEQLTWRLGQAAEAHNRAMRNEGEDKVEYTRAENGAQIDRTERDAFADLLRKIGYGNGDGSS